MNSTLSRWHVQGGIWWRKPKVALRKRRQKHVDKTTVFVDVDFAGHPVSRKSTTGLVAQIGNHTVKSGSTLQSLTTLSVGQAEFYAVVKGAQVGLSLTSREGMKIEIQSGSSTANSLTDRFEELRICWNEASLCFSTTTTLQVCRIGILLTMDPTLHYKMKAR